jgi:hypothetical protein
MLCPGPSTFSAGQAEAVNSPLPGSSIKPGDLYAEKVLLQQHLRLLQTKRLWDLHPGACFLTIQNNPFIYRKL